jgi:GT2 family glycosyltransferase
MVPTISVVIPTRRRPDLLGRCLDRLAPEAQTLAADRYEVLVSDDGEPTVERFLAEKYPWASWGMGPRRGPAANRNAGVHRARGEWIAFTDDDCLPGTDWLAGFLAAVHSGCRVYEGLTTCVDGCRSPLETTPANASGGYLWSCNVFIRRDTFEQIGRFDEEFPNPYMEDVDLRERLVRAGYPFEFVPAAVVDHPPRRLRPGWRMVPAHEHWLYYWYKHGRGGLASPRLLWELTRIRAANILGHRFGPDTLRAIGSYTVELSGLLVRLPFWERKYRRRFLGG